MHRPSPELCTTPAGLLPDAERQALELAELQGHSYRTVAKILNEPEGTIKGRIRSGLAKLRTTLAAQDLQGP